MEAEAMSAYLKERGIEAPHGSVALSESQGPCRSFPACDAGDAGNKLIDSRSHQIEERLCRWLLRSRDLVENDKIELTQEFLAIMLGVQRSGVSIALADLQSRGFIASKRRLIVILNRPALEKFTNGSYGLAEAEYKRRVKRSN